MTSLFIRTFRRYPVLLTATLGIMLFEIVAIGNAVADSVTQNSQAIEGSWSLSSATSDGSGGHYCVYGRTTDDCYTSNPEIFTTTDCQKIANGRQSNKTKHQASGFCPSHTQAVYDEENPTYVTAAQTIPK